MDLSRLQQICIEDRYSKHNIKRMLRIAILDDPDFKPMIDESIQLIDSYIRGKYYKTKAYRISFLIDEMEITAQDIVINIFLAVMSTTENQSIQCVIGKLVHDFPYPDLFDAVTTIAELLAVVSDCGLYGFIAPLDSESGYLTIEPYYCVDEATLQYISDTKYLPPMICKPKEIISNNSPAHLTKQKDSIILGQDNHHNGVLAKDVLNIVNRVSLSLDLDVICYEEPPSKLLVTKEQRDSFRRLKQSSRTVYNEILEYGNTFHLTHKYDKRGRLYSQGYHINIQSTEYKKAAISLTNKLVIGD